MQKKLPSKCQKLDEGTNTYTYSFSAKQLPIFDFQLEFEKKLSLIYI